MWACESESGKTCSQKQVGHSLKSLNKYILKHVPVEALCTALVKPKEMTRVHGGRELTE